MKKPRKPKGTGTPNHYPTGYRLQDHCVAQRKCLGPCGKRFMSHGPGNRVCAECTQHNGRVFLSKGEQ